MPVTVLARSEGVGNKFEQTVAEMFCPYCAAFFLSATGLQSTSSKPAVL